MKKSKDILTAYHEAGHAVIAHLYEIPFEYVTIIPNDSDGSLGHVLHKKLSSFHPEFNDDDDTRSLLEKHIQVFLAGTIAEERFSGERNDIGASGDYVNTIEMTQRLFAADDLCSAFVKFQWLQTEYHFKMLDGSDTYLWENVKKVAMALLEKKTLTYEEVSALL